MKEVFYKGKKWSKDEVKRCIQSSSSALIKAIEVVHSYQTRDEQATKHTKYQNNMGFNATDAGYLSSILAFYQKNGFLTEKQESRARKAMVKYSGQVFQEIVKRAKGVTV